jgi:hypothetical protein
MFELRTVRAEPGTGGMDELVHEPLALNTLQKELKIASNLYNFRRTISASSIAGTRHRAARFEFVSLH